MLTGSDIVRLQHLFKTVFEDASKQMESTTAWDALANLGTMITSDGAEEDYRWLGDNPEFEELAGDISISDLAEYNYTIRNKEFAAAVAIRKNELEDDKMDIIKPRINGMPAGINRKWGKMIHDLLVNGHSALAFDGVAFFSAATGKRQNGNLFTGTISAANPTIAQVAADIRRIRTAGLKFKNSRGEIIGVLFDTFVVPPELEILFKQLAYSAADPTNPNANAQNPYQGIIKNIVVDPGLTDANDFYALSTGYSAGALIRQTRREVETVLDATFMNVNGNLFFRADFRGNAGYGFPQLAAKSVSSVV